MPLSTPACAAGTPGFREMLGVALAGLQRRQTVEASMAESADLGFTAGVQEGGSYVTVLKRSATCAWGAALDEQVPHPTGPPSGKELIAQQAEWSAVGMPPARLIADDAPGKAMADFRRVLAQEGLAPALRTFGRNNDFRLYVAGYAPFEGMDAANVHLKLHGIQGDLNERAGDRSADGTMTYSIGILRGSEKQGAFSCLQIWQFDAKVVNWGVRVLLLNRTAAAT